MEMVDILCAEFEEFKDYRFKDGKFQYPNMYMCPKCRHLFSPWDRTDHKDDRFCAHCGVRFSSTPKIKHNTTEEVKEINRRSNEAKTEEEKSKIFLELFGVM